MESIKVSVLQELFNNKDNYKINRTNGHQGVSDNSYGEVQGEYDEFFIFYRHPEFPENLFMKETYYTDSYGGDERLVKTEFVRGKEKTITVYEPI